MICKYCGMENPDGAKFCKTCGKRIDGKRVCPSCGALNPDDNAFCTECGKRIDGKRVCATCGELFEGRFCPKCGASATATPRTATVPAAIPAPIPAPVSAPAYEEPAEAVKTWQKVLAYCGGGAAMFAVLASLIFTFCIGFTKPLNASGFNLGNSVFADNIFYYFSGIYNDISLISIIGNGYYSAALYLPAVFGTIIAAGTMISVLVLTILAVVRFVGNLRGTTKKSYASCAFGAYAAFLAGAYLLLAMNHIALSASSGAVAIDMTITFGSATVAGIVLGAVGLGACAGCRIAAQGKRLLNKETLLRICFSGGALVFFAIMINMVARAPFSTTGNESTDGLNLNFGLPYLLAAFASMTPYSDVLHTTATSGFAYSLIGLMVQLAFIILLICALVAAFRRLTDGDKGEGLGVAIGATVVAIANLVFCILCAKSFTELTELTSSYGTATNIHYTYSIVALVFSVLALAAAIVHKALTSVKQQPAQPIQPVQPAQPIQPIQPVQPIQPIQPAQPVQPVQPEEPVQLEQPEQPVEPVQPEQPEQTEEPVQPEQPEQTDQTE